MFVNSTFMPVNDKFNIRANLGNINTMIFHENLLNFEVFIQTIASVAFITRPFLITFVCRFFFF